MEGEGGLIADSPTWKNPANGDTICLSLCDIKAMKPCHKSTNDIPFKAQASNIKIR